MVYLFGADLSQKPRCQKTNQIEDTQILFVAVMLAKNSVLNTNHLRIYIYIYSSLNRYVYIYTYLYLYMFPCCNWQKGLGRGKFVPFLPFFFDRQFGEVMLPKNKGFKKQTK